MEELIKIEKCTEIDTPVINARNLHIFLDIGKDFSTWIKDKIRKYKFVEGVDYARIYYGLYGEEIRLQKNEKLSDEKSEHIFRIEYVITLDMAKELAMVQNNERGRQVRKYFIEIEKIYNENYFINRLNRLFATPYFKKLLIYKTYFLRDAITEYVKIGKSSDVEKRFKTIKSTNPTVELISIIDKDVELELHHEYEHKRMNNEWFNLTEKDLKDIEINFKNEIL